jgi:uncharacterized damage-inducible protein DinB
MAGAGWLSEILELNTDLFRNVLGGVTEPDAQRRLHGANSIAFLAAHLVDARFFMATLMDAPLSNPIGEALKDARSVDDVSELPTLEAVRTEWGRVSSHVAPRLQSPPAALLAATSPRRFPVADASVGGGLAFLLQHESYHLGQMALVRRQLGYPAVSYERRQAPSR